MTSLTAQPAWNPARLAKPLWWSLCAPRRTARHLLDHAERVVFGRKPSVTPLSYNWAHVRLLVRDFRELSPLMIGRVVDLGAGASPYHRVVSQHASSYIAIDFPASLPRHEPRAIAGLGGNLERLPLGDASVDSVFSAQVLPHVRKPQAMAAEIHRVLRPGGHAIVTGSFGAPVQVEPYDFARFTPDGMAALLQDGGLEVLETRTHGDLFSSLAITISMSLLLTRLRPGEPPRLSRARQWLFSPLVLLLNLLSLLDAVLPFNRMPAGVLVVARRPGNQSLALRPETIEIPGSSSSVHG